MAVNIVLNTLNEDDIKSLISKSITGDLTNEQLDNISNEVLLRLEGQLITIENIQNEINNSLLNYYTKIEVDRHIASAIADSLSPEQLELITDEIITNMGDNIVSKQEVENSIANSLLKYYSKSDIDSMFSSLVNKSDIIDLATDVNNLKNNSISIEQDPIWNQEKENYTQKSDLTTHINDDILRWQLYLDTDSKLQQLQIQIQHILEGTVDVKLDSITTSIEENSIIGFTVTNPLGGQIVGTAGTYLLVGTGRIWINDILVFDNAGLSVGIGSKSYVQDVKQGDIIKSEALTSLTYTNYISK